MNLSILKKHQLDVLASLQSINKKMNWNGEMVIIESSLVYQIPLPTNPYISGAFFIVESNDLNIRLYLTLPYNALPSQIPEISKFVIQHGYGLKYGALEFDLEHGFLRIRMDKDIIEKNILDETIMSLFNQALKLGYEISPKWKNMVCKDR